ncbi:MAG: ABC transporter substrate-binding protein [Nocardioides sp.]|uniref:ABC transporter substrate-binding protein n=1 Tax=Nocardioides sp. TaxID=35761 RepID=UPI0039E3B04B
MRKSPLPRLMPAAAALGLALSLVGCAGAPEPEAQSSESGVAGFPVTVSSCGHESTLTAPPEHAVTLNQGATEVALALGVEDQMAGTAYLDDAVAERWSAAYDTVPVLSKEYPSREEFLAADPDFAYASYGSAFERKAVGTQEQLDSQGIASYLSPFGCDDTEQRPAPSFQAVWDEVTEVGKAFGVPDRAADVVKEQTDTLAELADQKAGQGVSVLWYDSGRKTPFVGAGDGGPGLVMDAVGADNVFADHEGNWFDASWEDVLAADPDVIVVVDASWDTAKGKIAYLSKDKVLRQLTAVKEKRFVTIPFSESTPGVRLVDGARSLADQLGGVNLPR